MRWSHLAFMLLTLAPHAVLADEDALAEQLTRELDEKIYAHLAGRYSRVLKSQHLTSQQVDYRIRTASRQHAECAVDMLRKKAAEDGRSVEAALHSTSSEEIFRREIETAETIESALSMTAFTYCGRVWIEAVEEYEEPVKYPDVRSSSFSVGGTRVMMLPPDGFLPVTDTAIASDSGKTQISFEIKDKDISGVDMDKLRGAFQRVLDKSVPAAEWQRSEVWHHSGQDWVLLELRSGAADLHKTLLVTAVGDRMLMMNFESTLDEFPRYEQALRESIKSIQLDEAR